MSSSLFTYSREIKWPNREKGENTLVLCGLGVLVQVRLRVFESLEDRGR